MAEVTDDKSLPKEERKRLQIEQDPAKSRRAKLAQARRQDLQPARPGRQSAGGMDSRRGCATMSCGPTMSCAPAGGSIHWLEAALRRGPRKGEPGTTAERKPMFYDAAKRDHGTAAGSAEVADRAAADRAGSRRSTGRAGSTWRPTASTMPSANSRPSSASPSPAPTAARRPSTAA